MENLFETILDLIRNDKVRISEHGYDELASDGLSVREIFSSIEDAEVLELYPEYPKGPCLLALQKLTVSRSIHVVWGIPKGYNEPAVLVTAYIPDPGKWSNDLKKRIS